MDVAKRLAALLARGEIMEEGLYAPDAQGWHNTDEAWAPMSEAPLRMAAVKTIVPDFHAEEIEIHTWTDGFAMQYAFVGSTKDGTGIRIVGCIVATVADGQITRLQEYVDSAHAAPIMQALEALASA